MVWWLIKAIPLKLCAETCFAIITGDKVICVLYLVTLGVVTIITLVNRRNCHFLWWPLLADNCNDYSYF